jgi:lysophospholipase L1-like esterase
MKTPLCFLLAAVLTSFVRAQAPAPATTTPNPAYAQVPDVPGLPRVLILGDSISIGYTLLVRKQLEGRANVHRPAENCAETANGVKNLDKWLGAGKWDLIHFNFGLHDMKYLDEKGTYVTPDKGKQVALLPEYEKNLRAIVARLKRTGAKLIFATTTPVPSQAQGRVENDELRYNEVAVRVMKETGVAIDDLHALAKRRQAEIQQPHNVHFTDPGYAALADAVVASIKEGLATPNPR